MSENTFEFNDSVWEVLSKSKNGIKFAKSGLDAAFWFHELEPILKSEFVNKLLSVAESMESSDLKDVVELAFVAKKSARYFEKISIDDFSKKIEEASRKRVGKYQSRAMTSLTPKVAKDIKVEFDLENITDSTNHKDYPPHGFHTLANGLTFLGMSAGGDWEIPVYFILYWDGKDIRGYVPKEGNTWNTSTKQAYGNDSERDTENIKKLYKDKLANFDKEELEGVEEDGESLADVIDLKWDKDLILKDIENRILEKQ